MQIVIVVLLVIIALSVAPWLFAIVAAAFAAVAAYGVLWAMAIAAGLVALIGYVLYLLLFGVQRRERIQSIEGERKSCSSCQVEMSVKASVCPNCGAVN